MQKFLFLILSCVLCGAHSESLDSDKLSYVDLLEGKHLGSDVLIDHAICMAKNYRSILLQAEAEYDGDMFCFHDLSPLFDYQDGLFSNFSLENLKIIYYQIDCNNLTGLDRFSSDLEDIVIAYLKKYVVTLKNLVEERDNWRLSSSLLEDLDLRVIFSKEDDEEAFLEGRYHQGDVIVSRYKIHDQVEWLEKSKLKSLPRMHRLLNPSSALKLAEKRFKVDF